jgi:hypothetical protein
VVVAPVVKCDSEARTVSASAGKDISLLALVPLDPAEMDLKVTAGTGALIEALDSGAVSEVLDPARSSTATTPDRVQLDLGLRRRAVCIATGEH